MTSHQRLLAEISSQRKKLTDERNALRDERWEFERRMRKFREVYAKAWDVVMGHGSITELRNMLSSTDQLWDGFAGCCKDPDPNAGVSRYKINKQIEAISRRSIN